jgi:protein TonB
MCLTLSLEDIMFAELCTLESHRGWSFSLQALAVAGLFVLPLLYSDGLPLHFTSRVVAQLPPSGPPPPLAQSRPAAPASSNVSADDHLIQPPVVPTSNAHIDEDPAPPVDLRGIAVRGPMGDSRAWNPVPGSTGSGFNPVVIPPPPPAVYAPPISHMMEGNLIFRLQPSYPPLARQARIQGTVVLQAVISREGTIEKLQVLSGHPMLVQAAVVAVRQWRYRPYVLNGEPVEVETQVTVNFVLSGA